MFFIESSWSTPCLVLHGYIFNCHSRKNNREYWRCHNYSKKIQSERCHIRCVIEDGKLKSFSRGSHDHPPHTEKIEKMLERVRVVDSQVSDVLVTDIKISPGNSFSGLNSPHRNDINGHENINCKEETASKNCEQLNYCGRSDSFSMKEKRMQFNQF